MKKNNTASEGDLLFLTKPLGVGILTTAEKKGLLRDEHRGLAAAQMMQLNKVGEQLGKLSGVSAMTDVTGFALLGHLVEMAAGSGLSAEIWYHKVPVITPAISWYIQQQSIPGGTHRNWDSYGEQIAGISADRKALLADPQTSGGLLLAVNPAEVPAVQQLLAACQLGAFTEPIGRLTRAGKATITVLD